MDPLAINSSLSPSFLANRNNDMQSEITRIRQMRQLNAAPEATREEKMRKTADEFESFFMFQVLELMQPEISEDNEFTGGYAEEMFRHNLNEEISKAITERGGIGVSDMIYQQLLQYQEVQ